MAFATLTRAIGGFAVALLGSTLLHGATVTRFGIDDLNTTTTDDIQFFTYCPWVASAQSANANFSDWTFNFVDGGSNQIPQSDLTVVGYHPWAAVDSPTTDLGGTKRARPPYTAAKRADAGGAVFELIYTPRPADGAFAGDPTDVNFLQVFRERLCNSTDDKTCTWSDFTYFFDNFGSTTSPFYRPTGIGGTGVTKDTGGAPFTNATSRWMFDDSYDCEESRTPNAPGLNIGNSPSCKGGTDGRVLGTQVQFQVFPVTSTGKTVTIYRGAQWGYTYTNIDAPEPAAVGFVAFGLIVLAARRAGARRRAKTIAG